MGKFYLDKIPPYCRPFECSSIYPYISLFQSLSYVVTRTTPTQPIPDTIKQGFDKINSNFRAVEQAFQSVGNTYGRYRQNTNLVYHISAIQYDALTGQGLEIGDVLYYMTSSIEYPNGCWNFAQSTSGLESEALGVVTKIYCPPQSTVEGGCFVLTLNGYVSANFVTPLMTGSTYFLSHTGNAPGGKAGKTRSFNGAQYPGYVSKPIFTALSQNEIIVDIKRGVLVASESVW